MAMKIKSSSVKMVGGTFRHVKTAGGGIKSVQVKAHLKKVTKTIKVK